MKIEELLWHLEKTADPASAAEWDACGIQVRGAASDVHRLAVTLDPTPQRVREAVDNGADFILTHHPLSLNPSLPSADDAYTAVLRILFQSGCWLYAAHTSLDVCIHGPPAWLARNLGLKNVSALAPLQNRPQPCLRARLSCRLEAELAERLTADPSVQFVQNPEHENSEVIMGADAAGRLERLLKDKADIHWMERIELLPEVTEERGFGLIGDLEPAVSWNELTSRLGEELSLERTTRVGHVSEPVTRLAYCPGSGMSLAARAFDRGAQVFISGDLKYHQAQELEPLGLVLDVGHFILEEEMMRHWTQDLSKQLQDRDIRITFFPGHNPLRSESLA